MALNKVDGGVRAAGSRRRMPLAIGLGLLAVAAALFIGMHPAIPSSDAAVPTAVPMPEIDEPALGSSAPETAVLAGGCFWGVQGLFQHVKGVIEAESGYAGGDAATANYETVSTGSTGHAESVRVTYDPTRVTFGQLLAIYFSVVQDPTQLNRQGPDHGTQYRSAIFAQDETQKRVAESYIAQLNRAAVFPGPIVTTVSPKSEFFAAEQYHQDYMNSNPTQPYVANTEMPKLADLKRYFPAFYSEQPVLVNPDSAR